MLWLCGEAHRLPAGVVLAGFLSSFQFFFYCLIDAEDYFPYENGRPYKVADVVQILLEL
jgi:hypothetical protein